VLVMLLPLRLDCQSLLQFLYLTLVNFCKAVKVVERQA
jgi:hypothetical protein